MLHKAAETTHNINNAFGRGTANKCTVLSAKEPEAAQSLVDEERSSRSSEVDRDWLRGSSKLRKLDKWAPHALCVCLVAQSCLTLCDPVDSSPSRLLCARDSPGKNTGVGCQALLQGIFPTQGSNPGLLHCRRILYCLSHQGSPSWADCKSKKLLFWNVIFSYSVQQQVTISWLDFGLPWKVDFIQLTSDDQLSIWTKKKLQNTSQSQTGTKKKVLVTVWWSACLTDCTCDGFAGVWILAKPSHLRSALSRWMRCTEHRSRRWATERARLFSPQCLAARRTSNTSDIDQIELQSFASSSTFARPLTHLLPLLQTSQQLLAAKMLPQPAGCRKCLPRVRRIPKHGFFCYGKQLFLFGKNVLIVMVPVLINKDVFEPSYNNLKCMAQNCNYFYTNLINAKPALHT